MAETKSRAQRARNAADLGGVARSRRREQGLTQERLADLVGTHRNQIRKLETGTGTTSLALMLRVLNELGLDLFVGPRDVHRGLGR